MWFSQACGMQMQNNLLRILKGAVLRNEGMLNKHQMVHWTTCVTEQVLQADV